MKYEMLPSFISGIGHRLSIREVNSTGPFETYTFDSIRERDEFIAIINHPDFGKDRNDGQPQ